jgi:4-amino-4-deoxy-L-arabinose transferase-like glycosyltransferase
MSRVLRSPALWIAALALVLALGFLGSRGIWDPDEGRYTNVALNMLDSGDWLNPRRNDDVGHWTKPPLTYWAIASSVGVFGKNPWAARLPAALAYLLSIWLAWCVARRLAPGAQAQAAVIYATMLFTLGASQLITTDYILAACLGVAISAFVEARFGRAYPRRWLVVMWVGFALAFLTKGPPALLPLLVVLLFDQWMPDRRGHRALQLWGLGAFVLLALPWYIAVIHGNPGLFEYFIGDEVVNRVTTNEFGRHGEWYGWLQIYAPTLLLGTLPWTPALLRWARGLPAQAKSWWRNPQRRAADAPWLLLALWVLLPLLVFCMARSRLPLYLLPLFLPLAVIAARQRQQEGRGLPRWHWLLLWAVVLLGLKFAAAHWPTHKNAAVWAAQIRERAPDVGEVVFIEDMARYGLRLHLDVEIEKISLAPLTAPRFNPPFDEDLATELAESRSEPGTIWICKQEAWPLVQQRIAQHGFHAVQLGAPYEGRVIFHVRPR